VDQIPLDSAQALLMRFHLDESLSDEIARTARRLGVDVASSHEAGNDGLRDDAQLAYAARESRCIVTTNYADFSELAWKYAEGNLLHAGILLLPRSLLPSRENVGAIARALQQYNEQYLDEVYHHTGWLHSVE
jgi:predicted nuclease of predicted toxin-antitoxin system